MVNKSDAHSKAEAFRRQIVFPRQRTSAIKELVSKESFDKSDYVRVTVLFQKISYLDGCEPAYRELISRLKTEGDEKLLSKTERFSKKLEM